MDPRVRVGEEEKEETNEEVIAVIYEMDPQAQTRNEACLIVASFINATSDGTNRDINISNPEIKNSIQEILRRSLESFPDKIYSNIDLLRFEEHKREMDYFGCYLKFRRHRNLLRLLRSFSEAILLRDVPRLYGRDQLLVLFHATSDENRDIRDMSCTLFKLFASEIINKPVADLIELIFSYR